MTTSDDHHPRDRNTALFLFAGAGLIYAGLWPAVKTISPDGFIYLELAKNIPAVGYQVLGEPHQKFLPLYPALMAFLHFLSAGRLGEDAAGFLISMLSGAALPPLVFLLTRKQAADFGSALLVGLVQVLLAVGISEYCDLSVLPLFTALFTLLLFFLGKERFFPAGLIAGLAVTTRYELYLFLPLLLLADFRNPRRLAAAGAGLLLTAGPWWLRNFILYGRLIRTYYIAELTRFNFHLPQILAGFLLHLGPLLLLAALLGFLRFPRRWKIYTGGFSLLYIALHTTWWWYNDRFLLPLIPLFLIAAGGGLSRIREFGRRRFPARRTGGFALLAILTVTPIAFFTIYLLQAGSHRQMEPDVQAASYLKNFPPDSSVLASNSLKAAYYSGLHAYPLRPPEKGQTPHELIFQHCRQHNVRFLIWTSKMPVDVEYFNFLRFGNDQIVPLPAENEGFFLHYIFLRRFSADGEDVLIYRLEIRKGQ